MKNYYSLFFILLISIFSIAPFFANGFFPMHDDTQVARVSQMAESLSHGMFPVRWVMDLGYGFGYPIFNYYGPLAYYLGAFFNLSGIDALNSTKIMMIIGTLIAGFGMYLFSREFWGKYGAFISAVLYLYAPYHAVIIYVRGAVAELFAYGFLPFILWSILKINKTGKFRYVVACSIFILLLITSHNLTAMMFFPIIFILISYLIIQSVSHRKYRLSIFLFASIIGGILTSSFYWLPALLQLEFTNVFSQVGGGARYGDHYVCIPQLWESLWGFGGSTSNCVDGMSYRIGKLHIFALVSSLFVFLFSKYKKERLPVLTALTFVFVSIFMTSSYSHIVWESISVLPVIQYPWRFLSFIALGTSFLGGAFIWFIVNKIINKRQIHKLIFVLLISLGIVLVYKKLFVPQTVYPRDEDYYTNQKMIEFDTSKISDEYLPKEFVKPKNYNDIPKERFSVVSGSAELSGIYEKTTRYRVVANVRRESLIQARIANFPAWRLFVDGKENKYRVVDGKITFLLPVNKHEVILLYISTLDEKISNFLSIIGFISLLIGIIVAQRKKIL